MRGFFETQSRLNGSSLSQASDKKTELFSGNMKIDKIGIFNKETLPTIIWKE